MTNGERYKIFKAWFESNRFPEMHSSYKDAFWQGFEAGHRIASKANEAAPELLGALQEMVAIVKKNSYPQPDKPASNYARAEFAESIIKKALGEKQ